MRKLAILCLIAHSLWLTARTQYWQQQVNYTIDVTLNDKDNSLNAFEKIEYINNSPDTIHFIWFHIWPNAYKNDRTAFSDQLLLNGKTNFYFSSKEERGYINRLDFKMNNVTCNIEDHPQYIDVIKVMLPVPLAPGQKTILTTPFFVKLPFNFSRGGHDGESYQVTQWYPKPAVYDKNGWHPMPYLDQGEFYSEFGNFDVRITLPKNYVVAATGELQDAAEKEWLLTRKDYTWQPVKHKIKLKSGSVKTIIQNFPASDAATKTLRYLQNNVHDFAWFADKRFIVDHDTCATSSKTIDVYTYYTPQYKTTWEKSNHYAKRAVKFYSTEVGEYPFNILSVVQGPASFGGGMEYPTITAISPTPSLMGLDDVIAHEIGHNWFYGILATNERDHAWMDEGINSFYEKRYVAAHYKEPDSWEKVFFETYVHEKKDQPIETTSEKFQVLNYALDAYFKTSQWMLWLQEQVGEEAFDKAMKEYYRQWQFKHPQPEDFKKILEESTGRNFDSAFAVLNQKGIVPNMQRSGTSVKTIFSPHYFTNWLKNTYKSQITIGPIPGFNSYDKFMLGAFITNVRLPVNDLKFFVAPMYAFGSKRLSGLATIGYSFFPNNAIHKIDLFLNGSTFSMNKYTDSADKNHYLAFEKIVPGVRFTFREKDPRSTLKKYIQWKTYFINEEDFRFPLDTIVNGPDSFTVKRVVKFKENRVLNQLKLVAQNDRALYPWRAELNAEQGKGFIRLGFTGNYFFNYSSNKGGVAVRFFGGKFFYLDREKADAFRYALNLSAPKGIDDYTYSDYFIGRNDYPFKESGIKWTLPYQQIMIRDGALKMNTDIQGNTGVTDDWLSAINASFDIPAHLNPLAVLPIKIPLKIFVDVGTSAPFWDKESDQDRFLYDAGLQISLAKNVLNIYIPLVYSPVYRDYLKSDFIGKHRFFKAISFNIDVSNFNLKKIDRNFPF